MRKDSLKKINYDISKTYQLSVAFSHLNNGDY